MTIADGEVVARVLGGDPEPFALLFQKYGRLVHAVALARTTRTEAAAELTRRTFEKAYERLEAMPPDSGFRPFLLGVLQEEAAAWVKEHGRSLQMLRVGGREAKRASGGLDLPAVLKDLRPADAALVLLEVLARIPPAYEIPFLLRYVEGMGIADIAEVTGQTPAEVRTALDGGRRLFERELRHGLETAG